MDDVPNILKSLGIESLPEYTPELEGRLLDKIWEMIGQHEHEYDEDGNLIMPVFMNPRFDSVLFRLFDRLVQPNTEIGSEDYECLERLYEHYPRMKKDRDKSREQKKTEEEMELQKTVG